MKLSGALVYRAARVIVPVPGDLRGATTHTVAAEFLAAPVTKCKPFPAPLGSYRSESAALWRGGQPLKAVGNQGPPGAPTLSVPRARTFARCGPTCLVASIVSRGWGQGF